MRGLPLSKCVLLALTLLIPVSHGRIYPWRKGSQDLQYQNPYGKAHSRSEGREQQGRLSSLHHRPHVVRNAELREILEETFAELLDSPQASESRFPPPLYSNDLQDLGIGPEEEALYSARHDDRDERPREKSRHRHLSGRYQNYHQEVCATKKGWRELHEAVDVDGNEVVIVNSIGGQNQTYYSYDCVSPCTACKGVMGYSMCKMRYTYVKMYYHLRYGRRSSEPRWDFVEVPSHCACELVPENAIDADCPQNRQ